MKAAPASSTNGQQKKGQETKVGFRKLPHQKKRKRSRSTWTALRITERVRMESCLIAHQFRPNPPAHPNRLDGSANSAKFWAARQIFPRPALESPRGTCGRQRWTAASWRRHAARTHATDLTCPLVAASARRAALSRGPAASLWAPRGRCRVDASEIRLLDGVCGAVAAEVLEGDDAVCGPGDCAGASALVHAL
jgi:hypothetical protein